MPQKTCPTCSAPAPLDAGFCGQCGHQYRTQFTPDAGAASITGVAPETQGQAPTGQGGVYVGIAIMACIVALLILKVTHAGSPDQTGGQAARTAPAGPVAPPGMDYSSTGSGPEGANSLVGDDKRANHDSSKPVADVPASAIGPDGRIHLRGGGSITREQWDEGHRRLQNSPILRDRPSGE